MPVLHDCSPSMSARISLQEGKNAARSGDQASAEDCWKLAQKQSSTAATFDCGAMFLACAHLARLYHSWGEEYMYEMENAIRDAFAAFHLVFDVGSFVPPALSQIVNSLNEISDAVNQENNNWSEEQHSTTGVSILRYAKQELLEIGSKKISSPDDDHSAGGGDNRLGYNNIDVVVDIHPENLVSPSNNSKKKGGGKSGVSNAKKKKKGDDKDWVRNAISVGSSATCAVEGVAANQLSSTRSSDGRDVRGGGVAVTNTCPSASSKDETKSGGGRQQHQTSSLNPEQALAWANALDANLQSALGGQCVLLVNDSREEVGKGSATPVARRVSTEDQEAGAGLTPLAGQQQSDTCTSFDNNDHDCAADVLLACQAGE